MKSLLLKLDTKSKILEGSVKEEEDLLHAQLEIYIALRRCSEAGLAANGWKKGAAAITRAFEALESNDGLQTGGPACSPM